MPFYYNGVLGNSESGGGGTTDYNQLEESTLPKINNVIIKGDLSWADLGLDPEAILDVATLPTTNIKENVFYRITKQGYSYNNSVFIDSSQLNCYSFDSTITIDDAGLTDSETLDMMGQPTTYAWDALTDAIITSLGNRITAVDFVSDNQHFCRYGANSYNIATKFTETSSYELYFCKNNSWTLVVDTNDVPSYGSLSGKPAIDHIEIVGDRTSDAYGINKVITESDYNNLPVSEQNNNTTYFVDGDGTGAIDPNTYLNYENDINKPSINNITLRQGLTSADLDMYTRTEVDAKFSGVYSYKGVVANVASLPSALSSKTGDVYYVTAETASYAFNGSLWQSIGGVVDLTAYQTKQDNTLSTTSKTIVGGINELYNNKLNKTDVVNNLVSTSTSSALSANQGKVLQDTKQNISNLVTNFNNPTDNTYPSAKAVFDNFAPIMVGHSEISNSSAFNVDNCIWNMNRIVAVGDYRISESRLYANVTIVNPIEGNSMWGILEVKQSLAKNNTNSYLFIEQIFIAVYANGSTQFTNQFRFRRTGYYMSDDLTEDNIEANISNITWNYWYPIDYPVFKLQCNTTNIETNNEVFVNICGGTLTFFFSYIKTKNPLTATLVVLANSAPSCLAPKSGRYFRSTLIGIDTVDKGVCYFCQYSANNRNIELYPNGKNVATGRLFGQLSGPIGY